MRGRQWGGAVQSEILGAPPAAAKNLEVSEFGFCPKMGGGSQLGGAPGPTCALEPPRSASLLPQLAVLLSCEQTGICLNPLSR